MDTNGQMDTDGRRTDRWSEDGQTDGTDDWTDGRSDGRTPQYGHDGGNGRSDGLTRTDG